MHRTLIIVSMLLAGIATVVHTTTVRASERFVSDITAPSSVQSVYGDRVVKAEQKMASLPDAPPIVSEKPPHY